MQASQKGIEINLMAKATFAYYPVYLALFLLLVTINGVLIKLGSLPIFFIVLLGLVFLSLYYPKIFLFTALNMILTREMFVMEQTYDIFFEFIGYGPGPTTLGFLRTVMPDSKVYYNIPRAVFVATLIRLALLKIQNSKGNFLLTKKEFAVFLFIILAIASAVANLTFSKGSINFIVGIGSPIALFFYIQSIKIKPADKQLFIGYMLFFSLEVQVGLSVLNNWYQVVDGNFFFGDYATGTFNFPLSERSAYLIAIAFFAFLYRYLIKRQLTDLYRLGLAFYGILSISSVLFLLSLVAFTFASFALAYTMRAIKAKELALSIIAVLILAIPAVWVINNPELYYDGEHAKRHLEESSKKEIWEIPKIYAFINLTNMLHNEKRYLFGSGPATFLSNYGEGSLSAKYGSYNVLDSDHLSSSQRVENSFVGMVGELGIFGYLAYIWFYFLIYKDLRAINSYSLKSQNSPSALAVAMVMAIMFFFFFSFIRNVIEGPLVPWIIVFYAGITVSNNKNQYQTLQARGVK